MLIKTQARSEVEYKENGRFLSAIFSILSGGVGEHTGAISIQAAALPADLFASKFFG
jgi:hypothetical protein